MTIQGIIKGYADPADSHRNLLLIGRGDKYAIVKDGATVDQLKSLSLGQLRFASAARKHVAADWRSVREVATDAVGGLHVRELGNETPGDLLTPLAPQSWLNKPQRLFLESYDDGQFAHLSSMATETEFRAELELCGDGLVKFFINELSTSEDCTDMAIARSRIERVMGQIAEVADAFETESQWDGTVYVCVTGNASDSEDEELQGIYQVSIIGHEDVDLSNIDHQSATAKAVLDCFHQNIGISNLEDFETNVLLENGQSIYEGEESSTLDIEAHMHGSIAEQYAPAEVWEAFHQARQSNGHQRSSADRAN